MSSLAPRFRRIFPAFALLLAPLPAFAAENAFGTPEQEQALIANICGTQLILSATGCTCVAERAMTELSEPQRGYLIFSVIQPPAAERLEVARSEPDIRAIAAFIDTARQECAALAGAAPSTDGDGASDDGAGAAQ